MINGSGSSVDYGEFDDSSENVHIVRRLEEIHLAQEVKNAEEDEEDEEAHPVESSKTKSRLQNLDLQASPASRP